VFEPNLRKILAARVSRSAAAFDQPEVHGLLEERGVGARPASGERQRAAGHCGVLARPVGRPSHTPKSAGCTIGDTWKCKVKIPPYDSKKKH
jgi:hypothetical protein